MSYVSMSNVHNGQTDVIIFISASITSVVSAFLTISFIILFSVCVCVCIYMCVCVCVCACVHAINTALDPQQTASQCKADSTLCNEHRHCLRQ